MEIIRSKRATSSGQSTPGQPKSKYRKRSVRTLFSPVPHAVLVTLRPHSELRPRESAIRVTSGRLRNGDVGLMEREPCVMPAGFVSIHLCRNEELSPLTTYQKNQTTRN